MVRTLSIDPSGTGTSGICLISDKLVEFQEYKEKEWKKHYDFISSLVKVYQPNILLFENINYVSLRGKDMTSLFRLLGAIECLEVEKVNFVPVDQVKRLTKQLFKGEKKIAGLEYQRGRGKGWMFKGKRISIHCLEAYLVYYLFSS